ncbi:MAG: hypothetical protein J6P02_04045 [Lachnospiraceae bacterium]|nr:hypothetical protein [Lachnospiraceae bacterium]
MKSFNDVNTVVQNTPMVNVNQMIESIRDYYLYELAAGKTPKEISAIMLWGAPGVGKSESVYQISKILEQKTGKKVHVNDVRLSLYNPVDLRGIPSPNKEHTEAVWLKPEVFKFDESDDVINILFLDELSTCSTSVQACAYQITLDRKIGEHKLPDNVLVIAAGNRKQDQSVSIQMPKALANRMIHFDVCSEVKDWRNWALENNIDDRIIGFLAYKPNYLENGHESKSDLAYATPRSWAKASDILKTLGDSESGRLLISGTIGMGIATEFFHFCDCVEKLPNIDKIFKGQQKEVPKDNDILYTLITAMTTKAKDCIEKSESLSHAIKYAMTLPMDFSLLLHENFASLLSKKNPLIMIEDKDYMEWTEKLSECI